MSETFSHAKLYGYCHQLFCEKLAAFDVNQIHPAIQFATKSSLFYWYPATPTPLLNIINDSRLLADKGWMPGFFNTPFIIWYRNDNTIQCIPVDLSTASMVKKGSLNTDLPFGFKWVRVVCSRANDNAPVYVTADPVIAVLLIARGLRAVALGGNFLPKSHEKHLASLNAPLIYTSTYDQKDAALKFVTTMHKFDCQADVLFVDDLRDWLNTEDSTLNLLPCDGAAFAVERIMTKRRTQTGLDIQQEVCNLLNEASETYRHHYKKHFDQHKIDTKNANVGNACYLMSELLRANMAFEDAKQTVNRRYGITLSYEENG